jgi:hypothetical protein
MRLAFPQSIASLDGRLVLCILLLFGLSPCLLGSIQLCDSLLERCKLAMKRGDFRFQRSYLGESDRRAYARNDHDQADQR